MKAAVVCVLLFACVVLAQPNRAQQISLSPVTADGFDIVEFNDMSFVNEIHFQNANFTPNAPFSFNESSFFMFGGFTTRSLYPGQPQGSYTVGPGLRRFVVPYVDMHSFMVGPNTYFFGPTNPIHSNSSTNFGYNTQFVTIATSGGPGSWADQQVAFDGVWSAVALIPFAPIAYTAGFYLTPGTNNLNFGVARFFVNVSAIDGQNSTQVYLFNSSTDIVAVRPNAQFVTFNSEFKPFIHHFWNMTSIGGAVNTTYTYIVEPGMGHVYTVIGTYDHTVPLQAVGQYWSFYDDNYNYGPQALVVVSSLANPVTNTLILGLAVEGQGTGYLVFLSLLPTVTVQAHMPLPANFSDPRALVFDFFNPNTIYVGGNGGPSVLSVNVPTNPNDGNNKPTVTGMQNMPFYLHRVWRGMATVHHIYFITNEQHSKVFRLNKADFCNSPCMQWGYCQAGQCVCPQGMTLQGGNCNWNGLIEDQKTISKDKGGEIALGLLFAFTFIAAAAGWYMYWRNRRHSYQSV